MTYIRRNYEKKFCQSYPKIIITEGARKEYNLPKSHVEGFNGAEVSLKATISELEKYRV